MKKIIKLITCSLLLFTSFVVKAQVLYTENFDNHSVGNLGTDVTGKIPGQWGWYTASHDTQANSFLPLKTKRAEARY